MTAQAGALSGLKVLDLTRVLSGPFCTLNLADLGAEVIKLEHPERGDDTRSFMPPERDGVSTYFLTVNRNKKSLALDLKQPEGAAVLRDLVEKVDVLVENYRPGVMQRLGLGYESLKQINPSLIYAAISGYGQENSEAGSPGFDPVAQAESGLMSLTGEAEGAPMRTGVAFVDMFAGMYAAQAILAALWHRDNDPAREGQYVDVSLFHSALAMAANFGGQYLLTGAVPHRVGNGNQVAHPSGVFAASDGDFMITVANNVQFGRLCRDVLDEPELADDPRYKGTSDRVVNAGSLTAHLAARFRERPRDYWVQRIKAAGVPAGPVRNLGEAYESDLARELNLVEPAEHPRLGEIKALASPMNLSATPRAAVTPAPLLGQHSREVLSELAGYDEERIDALVQSGVVIAS